MTPVYIDGRRYIQDGLHWRVESPGKDGSVGIYFVDLAGAVPTCSCPSGRYRGRCRHLAAIRAILALEGKQNGKAQTTAAVL